MIRSLILLIVLVYSVDAAPTTITLLRGTNATFSKQCLSYNIELIVQIHSNQLVQLLIFDQFNGACDLRNPVNIYPQSLGTPFLWINTVIGNFELFPFYLDNINYCWGIYNADGGTATVTYDITVQCQGQSSLFDRVLRALRLR